MEQIGFVGLGIMGYGMAANLIEKSKNFIYGFDLAEEARRRFEKKGGKITETAEELYCHCDIICISLPTDTIVQHTVQEILRTARPGTIIIDFSSSSPTMIQQLAIEAVQKDMHILDAPVSGGEQMAWEGTLTIMVGGEKKIFSQLLPVLHMMGKTITYMGPSGCGCIAKVANNMMVGIHLLAVGEAFVFAKKAGLDPEVLFSAIKDGFAQSMVMDVKVPKILARDFQASARIAVHLKDIRHAEEMADTLGVKLVLTDIVREQMEWMERNGMIGEDQCALVKYYEHVMGVEV